MRDPLTAANAAHALVFPVGPADDLGSPAWGHLGAPLRGELSQVYSLDFSADGQLLAAGVEDGRILRWNLRTRKAPGPLKADDDSVTSMLPISGNSLMHLRFFQLAHQWYH